MSIKVVYFTRTGSSERVAEKIAKELSTNTIKITDDLNWKGPLGYMKAGYYSMKNKNVEIKIHGNIDAKDEIVFVSPLWAGGLSPAAKAFLKKFPSEKVHLVVTSKGSQMKETSGFKSIIGIVERNKNEDELVKNLVNNLK